MGKSPSRWAVAADQLRAMIQQGAFASGRLASEPAIAAILGVSRATARQALARLEHDGVVIRKHGSGTFVNTALLHITNHFYYWWR